MSALSIQPIPAFKDNYIWCLHDAQRAVVVDPGDAEPVRHYLKSRGLRLEGMLLTHHHGDHVGGAAALHRDWPQAPVWGPAHEPIAAVTHPVRQDDMLSLPMGLELKVLEVPGHTRGHVAYVGQQTGQSPLLFCGDTLFSSGCGRLFEGTAAQMFDALARLRALPADTRVFCAHEYTLSNLKFAQAVEPDHPALEERRQTVEDLRAQGLPSLPSTLALERQVNPFLRTDQPALVAAVARNCGYHPASEVETFAKLRAWKDTF